MLRCCILLLLNTNSTNSLCVCLCCVHSHINTNWLIDWSRHCKSVWLILSCRRNDNEWINRPAHQMIQIWYANPSVSVSLFGHEWSRSLIKRQCHGISAVNGLRPITLSQHLNINCLLLLLWCWRNERQTIWFHSIEYLSRTYNTLYVFGLFVKQTDSHMSSFRIHQIRKKKQNQNLKRNMNELNHSYHVHVHDDDDVAVFFGPAFLLLRRSFPFLGFTIETICHPNFPFDGVVSQFGVS